MAKSPGLHTFGKVLTDGVHKTGRVVCKIGHRIGKSVNHVDGIGDNLLKQHCHCLGLITCLKDLADATGMGGLELHGIAIIESRGMKCLRGSCRFPTQIAVHGNLDSRLPWEQGRNSYLRLNGHLRRQTIQNSP